MQRRRLIANLFTRAAFAAHNAPLEINSMIDSEFLKCVADMRYSNEWVGIALRNRLNTGTLYVAAPRTEAGPSIEAINSARYVMYNARDFGEHEAILANEIMRLDVNKQQDK